MLGKLFHLRTILDNEIKHTLTVSSFNRVLSMFFSTARSNSRTDIDGFCSLGRSTCTASVCIYVHINTKFDASNNNEKKSEINEMDVLVWFCALIISSSCIPFAIFNHGCNFHGTFVFFFLGNKVIRLKNHTIEQLSLIIDTWNEFL